MLGKKGQGLPLNTIIIAIIVIVVLVVIILIFTGQLSGFQSSTQNACQKAGGQCVSSGICGTTGTEISGQKDSCGGQGIVCCKI